MKTDVFANRHIGITENDLPKMLERIGVKTLDELIDKTIPEKIRLKAPLNLPPAMTERKFAEHIGKLASMNKIYNRISVLAGTIRLLRLSSNAMFSRIRYGTLHTLLIRQKYHRDVWRLCLISRR